MVELLIDQALREAIDLHNRNQLDDAKSLYNKIIEHDKDNSDAYHLLSLISFSLVPLPFLLSSFFIKTN